MHDLATPLMLALIGILLMVMTDPLTRPAIPVAAVATLMSIIAVAALPAPLPASTPVARPGWCVAILAAGMAARAIWLRCLYPSALSYFCGVPDQDLTPVNEGSRR